MNYRRSRVYSAPIPKMPPGLIELMEGLSKDVLRNNPTDIYEFCADHMQKLLHIRDEKPTKDILSLEQKIMRAQKLVNERAKQRRENYDKIIAQRKDEFKNRHSSQNLDEAPRYVQQNIIKIPDEEISLTQVELYDANALVEIKEQNIEIINNRDADEPDPTSLNMIAPVGENINLKCTPEKDNEMEGNEQHNGNCKELDKTHPVNKIEINSSLETEVFTYEEVEDKSCLASHVETEIRLSTSCEALVSVENVEIGTEEPDKENDFENESVEIDEVKSTDKLTDVKIQETVNVLDEHTEPELIYNEFESSPVLEAGESLNTESVFKLSKCAHSEANQSNSVERHDHIQEKDNKLSIDETKMLDGMDEGNNLISDGNNSINNGNNHNGMDLETAAITIQKVFRTFLFKSKTTSIDDATNVDINLFINDKDIKENINISNINNKERRGISRMDTVLQTVNEEKSLSLSTDDSSTLSSAATIIQAHIRGFLVRNKFNVNKTPSSSLLDSDGLSATSLEIDSEQKGKTILNIHIVPERGHFTSRDESFITSMELSMDVSPPSSANLHPHSYDINERRKQLKREDAIQSVSPPSNNSSSKLSEDVDSVRELLNPDNANDLTRNVTAESINQNITVDYSTNNEIHTAVEQEVNDTSPRQSIEKLNEATDETDVVTPFIDQSCFDSDNVKLVHSSEFHEVVLPTKVSRSDTAVVRGE